MRHGDRLVLFLLVLDAVVLAVLELFFLPLRFDGTLLPALAGDPVCPVTPVVAAITTPWLVAVAGRLRPRLGVAGLPLFAWLITLGVLAFAGPGGDQMLVADWRSLVLLGGGALPSAVVLGNALGRAPRPDSPARTSLPGRAVG